MEGKFAGRALGLAVVLCALGRRIRSFVFASLVMAIASPAFADVYNYATLSDPDAVPTFNSGPGGTWAYGIGGNTVVGAYVNNTGQHGFSETNGVYTPLDDPFRGAGQSTVPQGISGNTVVGYFSNSTGIHGFSETNGLYTTLDNPSAYGVQNAYGTYVTGLSGNTVVGYYNDSSTNIHGFSETNGNYTTLDVPGGSGTHVTGISGNTIVGFFYNGITIDSFSYDMTDDAYTIFNESLSTAEPYEYTYAYGISGNTIVGSFENALDGGHGFSEANGIYTFLDDPSAEGPNGNIGYTTAYGIDGSTVVGAYFDNGTYYGFIATPAPEPASLGILSIGVFGMLVRRRA